MSTFGSLMGGGMTAQAMYDSAQGNAYLEAKEAGIPQDEAEMFAHWWALADIPEEAAKQLMDGRSNRTKVFERSWVRVMKSLGYDVVNGRFKVSLPGEPP